ncbi:MAG: WG repeat-containing protein [Flavobacterium sp.]|nr:WG repeat-containing protein [Flavobacterium sp.]
MNRFMIFVLILLSFSCIHTPIAEEPLHEQQNPDNGTYGFYNNKGIKVFGDYDAIYTKTLRDYAIVTDPMSKLIDRTGNVVYNIYFYDNGPDYTSQGLYRIVKDGKVGYVDSLTSKIVIPPSFSCAFPFEKGRAKVAYVCDKVKDGEHTRLVSSEWFYINKKGKIIKYKDPPEKSNKKVRAPWMTSH